MRLTRSSGGGGRSSWSATDAERDGDSRYLSPCDICDRNIDAIPRTHKSPHEGLRSAPPGTLPGEKCMIDGGDATVRSKWVEHRYFLVCICAVGSYPVAVYMKDQSARSFVTAIQHLDRLVRVRLIGRKITTLYDDFFSSHLDQSVFGVVQRGGTDHTDHTDHADLARDQSGRARVGASVDVK